MNERPTALVIDDEKNILKILRIGLEAIGLTVEAFGNPVEAIDSLEPGRYDIAFIDLMMAPVDGMQVLREIKKVSPSTTAVIITAHGSIDSAVEAIKQGAFDFLQKPFDLKELQLFTKKVLDHHRLEREVVGVVAVPPRRGRRLDHGGSAADAGKGVRSGRGLSPSTVSAPTVRRHAPAGCHRSRIDAAAARADRRRADDGARRDRTGAGDRALPRIAAAPGPGPRRGDPRLRGGRRAGRSRRGDVLRTHRGGGRDGHGAGPPGPSLLGGIARRAAAARRRGWRAHGDQPRNTAGTRLENRRKHGVSFAEAQAAFLDMGRVIAMDVGHSRAEPRFYCFGRVADGVLTVRFTDTAVASFESLAPATGGEVRNSMKRTRKYTDEPLGRLEVVEDFLPPPEKLVLKEDGVKVTNSLSRKSVDFFKAHAAASKVPYQRMIRTLLDSYAERFSKRAP